jgi:hypothetical protein
MTASLTPGPSAEEVLARRELKAFLVDNPRCVAHVPVEDARPRRCPHRATARVHGDLAVCPAHALAALEED